MGNWIENIGLGFSQIGLSRHENRYHSASYQDRCDSYSLHDSLYRSRPEAVFTEDFGADELADKYFNYTQVNWAKLVVDTFANLLFSSRPAIVANEQEYLDELLAKTDLFGELHKACKDSILKGDGIIKVNFDPLRGPVFQAVDPKYWRPVVSPQCPTKAIGGIFYFTVEDSFLVEEHYMPGSISYRVFEYNAAKDMLGPEVDKDAFQTSHPELTLTDLTFSEPIELLLHIPNETVTNSVFGISAVEPVFDMIGAFNRRLSEIGRIGSGQAYPLTVLPTVVAKQLEKDSNSKSRFDRRYQNVINCSKPEDAAVIRIIENKSNLESLFKELEVLEEKILATAKLTKAALGLDKGGSSISGRSRYFALLPTLQETEVKAGNWSRAIQSMLYSAMWLDQALGQKTVTPERVVIKFADDLIRDLSSDIVDTISELSAGLISKETARTKLGYDSVEEESRIAKEKPSTTAPPPQI